MPPKPTAEQIEVLRRLGLRSGEPVRFRRADRARWQEGRISWVERDGSITVHDSDGAARSLRPERLEVKRPGRRGRLAWRAVPDIAVTWEQLTLF